MRQLFIIGAVAALISVTVPARAELKFAYVDVQRALNQCDAGKKAKAEFRGKVQSVETKLQRQQSGVQALKDELEKKGMLMSPDQRQNLQDKYTEKLTDFKHAYQDSQTELQAKDNEITTKIVHDLAEIIRRLGQRDGYTMVMEKGSILWGAPNIDITDQVIRAYNATHAPIGTLGAGGAGGAQSARSAGFGANAERRSTISK
ncbi:MAG: OmpH family outer membrane protein [Candidatus Binataceae bacterium]